MINYSDFSSHGYEIERELGRNLTGGRITYLAREIKTDQRVVIKQFQFAQPIGNWRDYEAIQQEIRVLQKLNHPSIPYYLDCFDTSTGFCLVQEYKNAPSLAVSDYLTPEDIQKIAVKCLEILIYLQQQQPVVIHRDIKPENLLVSQDKKVYLVDFGLAKLEEGEISSTIAKGTFGFMPPEQIYKRQLTKASDLYSLGVTLICLLTRTKSNNIGDLIDENERINFKNKLPKVSRSFIHWLKKIVERNPEKRFIDAEEALKALISGKNINNNGVRIFSFNPIPILGRVKYMLMPEIIDNKRLAVPRQIRKGYKSIKISSQRLTVFCLLTGLFIYASYRWIQQVEQQHILAEKKQKEAEIAAEKKQKEAEIADEKKRIEVKKKPLVIQLQETRACVGCDLSGASLKGLFLEKVNLEKANLQRANLSGTKLKGANLSFAKLQGSELENTELETANLEGANLKDTNLKCVNLQSANLRNTNLENIHIYLDCLEHKSELSNLKRANLKGANLKNANLEYLNLEGANLKGANLKYAKLKNPYLEGANLEDANLKYANLENPILEGANLKGANLINAKLEHPYLKGANLEDANLKNAKLEYAELQSANLKNANLEYANLENATFSRKRDFSIAEDKANLENANLEGANLKYAQLEGVNLKNANLKNADFSNATLREANLDGAKTVDAKFDNTIR